MPSCPWLENTPLSLAPSLSFTHRASLPLLPPPSSASLISDVSSVFFFHFLSLSPPCCCPFMLFLFTHIFTVPRLWASPFLYLLFRSHCLACSHSLKYTHVLSISSAGEEKAFLFPGILGGLFLVRRTGMIEQAHMSKLRDRSESWCPKPVFVSVAYLPVFTCAFIYHFYFL